jgi:hypothetical protein
MTPKTAIDRYFNERNAHFRDHPPAGWREGMGQRTWTGQIFGIQQFVKIRWFR